jgi:hypothetical protein
MYKLTLLPAEIEIIPIDKRAFRGNAEEHYWGLMESLSDLFEKRSYNAWLPGLHEAIIRHWANRSESNSHSVKCDI